MKTVHVGVSVLGEHVGGHGSVVSSDIETADFFVVCGEPSLDQDQVRDDQWQC